jgi:tetratricopeptide (TPR) repeat protein
VSLNPDYARAFCYRAYVHFLMKHHEEAVQDCEHVIKLLPTDIPDVYYVRGLLYAEKEELDRAIRDLQYCLEIQYKTRVFSVSTVKENLEKLKT